jgi:hypothetical protein
LGTGGIQGRALPVDSICPDLVAEIGHRTCNPANSCTGTSTFVAEKSGSGTSIEVRPQLAGRGAVPRPTTPEEFDAFVKSEVEKMAGIVKAAGLKTD